MKSKALRFTGLGIAMVVAMAMAMLLFTQNVRATAVPNRDGGSGIDGGAPGVRRSEPALFLGGPALGRRHVQRGNGATHWVGIRGAAGGHIHHVVHGLLCPARHLHLPGHPGAGERQRAAPHPVLSTDAHVVVPPLPATVVQTMGGIEFAAPENYAISGKIHIMHNDGAVRNTYMRTRAEGGSWATRIIVNKLGFTPVFHVPNLAHGTEYEVEVSLSADYSDSVRQFTYTTKPSIQQVLIADLDSTGVIISVHIRDTEGRATDVSYTITGGVRDFVSIAPADAPGDHVLAQNGADAGNGLHREHQV